MPIQVAISGLSEFELSSRLSAVFSKCPFCHDEQFVSSEIQRNSFHLALKHQPELEDLKKEVIEFEASRSGKIESVPMLEAFFVKRFQSDPAFVTGDEKKDEIPAKQENEPEIIQESEAKESKSEEETETKVTEEVPSSQEESIAMPKVQECSIESVAEKIEKVEEAAVKEQAASEEAKTDETKATEKAIETETSEPEKEAVPTVPEPEVGSDKESGKDLDEVLQKEAPSVANLDSEEPMDEQSIQKEIPKAAEENAPESSVAVLLDSMANQLELTSAPEKEQKPQENKAASEVSEVEAAQIKTEPVVVEAPVSVPVTEEKMSISESVKPAQAAAECKEEPGRERKRSCSPEAEDTPQKLKKAKTDELPAIPEESSELPPLTKIEEHKVEEATVLAAPVPEALPQDPAPSVPEAERLPAESSEAMETDEALEPAQDSKPTEDAKVPKLEGESKPTPITEISTEEKVQAPSDDQVEPMAPEPVTEKEGEKESEMETLPEPSLKPENSADTTADTPVEAIKESAMETTPNPSDESPFAEAPEIPASAVDDKQTAVSAAESGEQDKTELLPAPELPLTESLKSEVELQKPVEATIPEAVSSVSAIEQPPKSLFEEMAEAEVTTFIAVMAEADQDKKKEETDGEKPTEPSDNAEDKEAAKVPNDPTPTMPETKEESESEKAAELVAPELPAAPVNGENASDQKTEEVSVPTADPTQVSSEAESAKAPEAEKVKEFETPKTSDEKPAAEEKSTAVADVASQDQEAVPPVPSAPAQESAQETKEGSTKEPDVEKKSVSEDVKMNDAPMEAESVLEPAPVSSSEPERQEVTPPLATSSEKAKSSTETTSVPKADPAEEPETKDAEMNEAEDAQAKKESAEVTEQAMETAVIVPKPSEVEATSQAAEAAQIAGEAEVAAPPVQTEPAKAPEVAPATVSEKPSASLSSEPEQQMEVDSEPSGEVRTPADDDVMEVSAQSSLVFQPKEPSKVDESKVPEAKAFIAEKKGEETPKLAASEELTKKDEEKREEEVPALEKVSPVCQELVREFLKQIKDADGAKEMEMAKTFNFPQFISAGVEIEAFKTILKSFGEAAKKALGMRAAEETPELMCSNTGLQILQTVCSMKDEAIIRKTSDEFAALDFAALFRDEKAQPLIGEILDTGKASPSLLKQMVQHCRSVVFMNNGKGPVLLGKIFSYPDLQLQKDLISGLKDFSFSILCSPKSNTIWLKCFQNGEPEVKKILVKALREHLAVVGEVISTPTDSNARRLAEILGAPKK